MSKKTSIDDIIGLVDCEPTDSVEEVRKLRGRDGMSVRFIVDDAGTLIDMETRDMFDIVEEVCPLLNILAEENEQLKQEIEILQEQIAHFDIGGM